MAWPISEPSQKLTVRVHHSCVAFVAIQAGTVTIVAGGPVYIEADNLCTLLGLTFVLLAMQKLLIMYPAEALTT